ncbi:MAG: lysophospholipid acyltransferase family protein [Polyangiaceae bacterium]
MGVKETFDWVTREWGIIARRDEMSLADAARWLRQWVPFGAKTIGYGTVSLTAGPLTPDYQASAWAQKQWSRSALEGLRITAEVHGEHLVPGGGLMYASNHQSLLDILVLGAVLPGDLKWATKRSIMNVPFLGWHLRLAGHVPVDRQAGSRAAAETIKRFVTVLEQGKPLLVFPEGTRSDDGEIHDFKNGGFYAAVRAGVPVVPVALEGTHQLMGKHAVDAGDHLRPRHVVVRIGEALHANQDGKERDRVADLRDRCHAAVVDLHGQIRAAASL